MGKTTVVEIKKLVAVKFDFKFKVQEKSLIPGFRLKKKKSALTMAF